MHSTVRATGVMAGQCAKKSSTNELTSAGFSSAGQVRNTVEDDERRAGDRVGHGLGLGVGERRVLDAGDDEHGCHHAAQQLPLIGSAGHHAAHRPRTGVEVDGLHGVAHEGHDVGTRAKRGGAKERLEHRPGQRWADSAEPPCRPQHQAVLELLPCAGGRRRAVHQHRLVDAVGVGGGERAADHAAPRVADEVRSFDAEAVEQVDDAACTLLKRERSCERLAFAVSGGVDQHHPMPRGEVVRLCRPHVAGHQQARPEQDGVALAAGADPQPAKCGVDCEVLHHFNASAQFNRG